MDEHEARDLGHASNARPCPARGRFAVRGLGLIMALALAQPTFAWGPVGHRAVGEVAQSLLTPAARVAVAELLADDRDRDGQPSGRRTLAEVANWPDEIRGSPGDRPHWHYDNRPVCRTAGAVGPRDARPWCQQDDCATAQLERLIGTVGDRSRPVAERNEALKWVVHLAGDLHQPLHAADLAQGGNMIHVLRRGHERESLHMFWDVDLVAIALHPIDGEIPASAMQRLERRARAQEPARVAAPPERWAQESNDLARTVALDLPGVGCEGGARSRAFQTIAPNSRYVRRGRAVAEERLALAGARLAYVLNTALGDGRK